MLKLYGFPPTRTIRVLWALREMGLPFEFENVNLPAGAHRRPEFLAVNPAGKVPALVDGDFVLTESVAIVLYLVDKYPDKGFAPTDARGRAEMNRWLLFTATELEQPLWRIARHTTLYPAEKRIAAEVPIARHDFVEMAEVMEQHLRDREHLVGDHATVADFVAAYTLDWANEVRLLESMPALRRYMLAMYARPKAPERIAAALGKVRAEPGGRERPPRIVSIHHAQIMIPQGREPDARRFYGELLGWKEIDKPAELRARGGLWMQAGDRQLHIGVEEPGVDRGATRAHVAYEVRQLEAWRTKLEAAGIAVQDGERIEGLRRFEFRDPFGNRVEFLEPAT